MIESNYVKGKLGMLVKQRVGVNVRTIAAAIATALIGTVLIGLHQTAAAQGTANTLKVAPVRSDISVEPGKSKKIQVVVTNTTNAAISVRPIQNDFVAGDERGTPALILDADKFAPTHSLKRFLAPIADTVIPANKSKAIDVVISVPANAQPGGYYGAVRFAPTTPDGGGQVNLSASVASLMLLTVPGEVVEKLDLTEFNIQQGGKTSEYFTSSNDLQATFRFKNSGGIQLGPIGKISVKQGDKVVYDTDFNNKEQRDVVLTDSARRWDVPLKNIGSFGNYTVTATYTYGTTNQSIEVTKSFWVVPQLLIIVGIVGILILLALIVGIIMLIRHRKKGGVLRSHGRGNGGMRKL